MSRKFPCAPSNSTFLPARSARSSVRSVWSTYGSSRRPHSSARSVTAAHVDRLPLVVFGELEVLLLGEALDRLAKRRRVEQIGDADPAPRHLVLVGGPDAAPGGADRAPARRLLARLVERAVPLEDHVRAARHAHARRVAQHAARGERVELAEQDVRVDDDAGADQVDRARMQDAGGHHVQHGLVPLDDERVAGVVAAVEAHHQIGARREPVDELALALVAPLRPDRDQRRHLPSSSTCTEIACGILRSASITCCGGA